jgi:SAM-dependent methyltransferase
MLNQTRARLARRSFDYQWAELPTGTGLLSDGFFAENVDRILVEEELCIEPEWFVGRRVLDAGCGNGRWIEGFLRLGCEVTAIDASPHAIAAVTERYGDRIRALQGDVLRADELLTGEKYDLVFSWGVLHHPEDPALGVTALGRLVADQGLLYVYLYGRASIPHAMRLRLSVRRLVANAMPLDLRRRLIERRYGPERAHAIWDEISTPLNRRFSLERVEAMLREAGFGRVSRTIPHSELFLRADRGSSSADGHLLPRPEPPFWFQRLSDPASHA